MFFFPAVFDLYAFQLVGNICTYILYRAELVHPITGFKIHSLICSVAMTMAIFYTGGAYSPLVCVPAPVISVSCLQCGLMMESRAGKM